MIDMVGHHRHQHDLVALHVAAVVLPGPDRRRAREGGDAAETLGELGTDGVEKQPGKAVPVLL